MHALRSAEFYPEAIGDRSAIQGVLYVDNLLGARHGDPWPPNIYPRTLRAIVVAYPMSATVVVRLKQPIVEFTRTAITESNPEVRNS